MKRFNKIYLEISNLCNLSCAFCPGTRRQKRAMTQEELRFLLPRLRPWSDYLYLHLMGEPLLHPELPELLSLAGAEGFRVILTTNGTLLPRQQELLLSSPAVHKVNISLHAFEANDLSVPFSEYLRGCLEFARAAEGRVLVSCRLWNNGGQDRRNEEIVAALHEYFPGEWVPERKGIRMGHRVYLEHGDRFDWPDLAAPDGGEGVRCYGLRDQIGVLCDGTVVPCCLDHEGDIPLGNLFTETMEEILASPRATAIFEGFRQGRAHEELCRKCGYARRFRT